MPDLSLHGVFLAIFDRGVLLQGPSGCGKSECALHLLDRGHQLIADDAPLFFRANDTVIGHSPLSLQNLLEVRGLGIIDVQQLYGTKAILLEKPLELIIEFTAFTSSDAQYERVLQPKLESKIILEQAIPTLRLNSFCKHMAILVETAVRLAFSPVSPAIEQLLKT